MDPRASATEATQSGDFAIGHCADTNPCPRPQTPGGKVVELGRAFVTTVRHFWPGFNTCLDRLPDTRFLPFVNYDKKFLTWWGLLLFCCKLGSRRQLDYELRDLETQVLANVNRLAGTQQDSLPVHKTLDHFLSHVGSAALAQLRTQCIRRLIRMKALDACRLLGKFVIAIDGTGFLSFRRPHCTGCLTHRFGNTTYYLHPVMEAKLVDRRGLALSLGTEFIENPLSDDASASHATDPLPPSLSDYEKNKQDCELKAFARLAPALKSAFPQTRFCISGDALFACGPAIHICTSHHWSYVFTFKSGRTPTLWEDFQGLLKLTPENHLHVTLPDGTQQRFRWVHDMNYVDSEGRSHTVNAILCREIKNGQRTTFAWITDMRVTANNVRDIAEKGGRVRSNIENQGFNMQKNSGLNLEHAYSFGTDTLKAFYYLLQIAHTFLQMLEKGSLLKHLAKRYEGTPMQLFGSLKNVAKRLLDGLRYFRLPEDAFDPAQAAQCQIRLDTS
jgi:hypothetical protein